MRREEPCSVCRLPIEAETLRPTVPSDWEFRFASMLVWNFEPGTNDRHRCRLKPRVQVAYIAPEEPEAPIAIPERTLTQPEEHRGTGGVVL